jgi:alpha-tubulin suppressor-like RCC1 family protein
MSIVANGQFHALALAEDGLMYAWGSNVEGAVLGNTSVEWEPLPKPVEALRGVRVGSIAAGYVRSYALADTGELWAWGFERAPLGHGDQMETACSLPKPIDSLRGVKVDAVAAGDFHTLPRADDRSVYAWGQAYAVQKGALGLSPAVSDAGELEVPVPTPQIIPGLRVACGL